MTIWCKHDFMTLWIIIGSSPNGIMRKETDIRSAVQKCIYSG